MEVDSAPSGTPAPVKHPLPELEIYCYLLVLIFLIDQKKYDEVGWSYMFYFILPFFMLSCCFHGITKYSWSYFQAKACSSASIARLKTVNRRTVDVLASRLYFYYSLCYELTGDLAEIRGWVSVLNCSSSHVTSLPCHVNRFSKWDIGEERVLS